MALTTVARDFRFMIPSDVAVCPYCGDRLVAECEAWSQRDDGEWEASELRIDCVSEPDLDDDDEESVEEWNNWTDQHTYMPYVYWLPMTIKVEAWVNASFRFKMEDQPPC